MHIARWGLVAGALALVATLLLPMTAAQAHANCTRTVTPPVLGPNGFTATGSVTCDTGHTYYWIRVCLEFSAVPGVDPWSNTECNDAAWNSTVTRTSWSVSVNEPYEPFPAGFWRARMISEIGSGSGHSSGDQYSAEVPLVCLPVKV